MIIIRDEAGTIVDAYTPKPVDTDKPPEWRPCTNPDWVKAIDGDTVIKLQLSMASKLRYIVDAPGDKYDPA